MWIVKLRDEGELTITSCLLCLEGGRLAQKYSLGKTLNLAHQSTLYKEIMAAELRIVTDFVVPTVGQERWFQTGGW